MSEGRRLRILQIHNLYTQPGGEDAIADAEAELLRADGHDVTALRERNPEGAAAAARALAAAPWNPASYRAMRRTVREVRPDVAHVHNTWFTFTPAVLAALRAEGVPIVMTLQNYRLLCVNAFLFRDGRVCTDCVGTHPWHGVQHACYRDSRPQSAIAATTITANRALHTWDGVGRFLAPSEFVKHVFVNAGFEAERITVKPNTVVDPGRRVAPPSSSRSVVYAGRLSPEKGVDTLLAGWAAAGAAVNDLELVIVGEGPQRTDLERVRTGGRALHGMGRWGRAADAAAPGPRARLPVRVVGELRPDHHRGHGAPGSPCSRLTSRRLRRLWRHSGPVGWWRRAMPRRGALVLARLASSAFVDAGGVAARAAFEAEFATGIGLERLLAAYESVLAAPAQNS